MLIRKYNKSGIMVTHALISALRRLRQEDGKVQTQAFFCKSKTNKQKTITTTKMLLTVEVFVPVVPALQK